MLPYWGNDNAGISCLMVDREGSLWAGTGNHGILMMTEKQFRMNFYNFAEAAYSAKSIPICESSAGTIYIGAKDKVLALGAARSGLRECCTVRSDIGTLAWTEKGLWIGTLSDGVYLWREGKGMVRHFPVPGAVRIIYPTADGGIELGTDKGLFSFNAARDAFETDQSRKDIRIVLDGQPLEEGKLSEFLLVGKSEVVALCENSDKYLYIATAERGIYRKDMDSRSWEHFISAENGASLPRSGITSLFNDRNETVWAGTTNAGLWNLKAGESVFRPFPVSNSQLGESAILGMGTDARGRFWVIASSGLYQVNTETGECTEWFGVEDYFYSDQVLQASSFCSSDGRIYFGGYQGITSFAPPATGGESVKPKIVIRRFRTEEESLNLPREEDISVSWKQNDFSFDFASLSFTNPKHNRYSWILKGYDKEWKNGTDVHSASYSKVPPGDYRFLLRASNSDGIWADDTPGVAISVRPPWWWSLTAKIFYVLLVLLLAASGIYLWNRRVQKRYAAMMERDRETRERELYAQRVRFFIGLVHEIRTPLTLIRIQREKEKTEGDDAIIRNLDYIQDTINKILSFDRNSSAGAEMLLVRCDLGEIARSTASKFRKAAEAKGIRLTEEIPGEPVWVKADEDMIGKILSNLLSNAIKYCRKTIRLSVTLSEKEAVAEVSDDGNGVSPDQKEKIFGMFYTPPDDKIAQASGIGVGLAYARQLAEAHKGSLTVEDAVPKGAAFVLRLPAEAESRAPEQSVPAYTGKAAGGGRTAILVVEDNAELLSALREELSQDYTVFTAYDGKEALAVLEKENVDTIVSDVMMPVMDGIELCRTLKGNLEYSHIPLILLTARVNVEDKQEGLESGADAYMEKPFSMRQLRAQIANLLKLRQTFRDAVKEGGGMPLAMLPDRDADFLTKINSAIDRQIDKDDFSIEELAGEMAMSRANFFRKFKSLTGFTPAEYLRHYRLQRAAQLILGGARVNEAAGAVGFWSSSHFAKCFKAQFGVLPKDYRKEQKPAE